MHDLAAQADAHLRDEDAGILTLAAVFRQGFGDRAQVADRDLFLQQVLQHLDDDAEFERFRRQPLDQSRRAALQYLEQFLHFLVADQLVRIVLQQLAQVSGDDRRRVDHGVAERLRVIAL